MKSKDIKSYFKINLSDLRTNVPIEFDIHLFFPQNNHIMLFRSKGEIVSEGLIAQYKLRGVQEVWIHQEENEIYNKYITPNSTEEAIASMFSDFIDEQAQLGNRLVTLLADEEMDPQKRTALVAKTARTSLTAVFDLDEMEHQPSAHTTTQRVVEEVLAGVEPNGKNVISDLWKIAEMDSQFSHALNVATYTVLLAFAFGITDPLLVRDLALAGLLHDVGVSQISAKITSIPWKLLTPEQQKIYVSHVHASVTLIDAYEPRVPDRVKLLIRHHHEKFNGEGYPEGLKGFDLDGPVQLLSLAELIDTVASGQWDGVKRTYKEALDVIHQIEKEKTFPEHFNPEILSAFMKWINHPTVQLKDAAAKVIQDQIDDLHLKTS